ncbi:urease subunit gamma [Actinomadura viridis]|uniref:Urease subunit gamma n=1 Tax=Actinomadura viridis TaxID=58110 RepID=A0A931GIJ7_9ACTN|nr:urease subunit gamma [Actinomadura viridis]MBG6088668.1 urease subunit gamma [Actinomadura viridis]
MNLTPREMDRLVIFTVAQMSIRRRDRGLKLNYGEAVGLITHEIVEAARDGKTVAECMELGKQVLGPDEVLPGVREMLPLLQIEAVFEDGTKLVSCHDPIGGK